MSERVKRGARAHIGNAYAATAAFSAACGGSGLFCCFGFRKEARPFEMWFVVVFFFYFYLFRVVGRLLATNKTIPHFHFVFYWEWEEKSVMNNISEWKKKRCIWPSVRERRCEWVYIVASSSWRWHMRPFIWWFGLVWCMVWILNGIERC